MDKERIEELTKKAGIGKYGFFDAGRLAFRTEVRDMCAANVCQSYGHSWACPPAIGTLEEIREKAGAYKYGIVLQETGEMEDDFDVEVMMETEAILKEKFYKLTDLLMEDGADVLPMGCGTCTRCAKCTYPGEPCRFPEKVFPSMEAYGLVVSDTCGLADVPYYYGPQTITYTCCVLF